MADGRPILVTGASGFVGTWLVQALRDRGEGPLVGVGAGHVPANSHTLEAFEALDLRRREAVESLVERWRPRAVYHLAGQASVAASVKDPVDTFAINAGGTSHLLEGLRVHAPDARILLVSSAEVYGRGVDGALQEETPLSPASPYAASKAALEALGLAYARSYGLSVVIARPFNHTGPGQSERFALGSFARQIAAIEAGRQPPELVVGNLEPRRDFLDVRDVVRAYEALLEGGEVGRIYNVCRGESHRIGALLDGLLAHARVGIAVREDPGLLRRTDSPAMWGDPTALLRATGWQPEIPLEQTLKDLLDAWRARMPYWGDAPTGLA